MSFSGLKDPYASEQFISHTEMGSAYGLPFGRKGNCSKYLAITTTTLLNTAGQLVPWRGKCRVLPDRILCCELRKEGRIPTKVHEEARIGKDTSANQSVSVV